MFVFSMNSLRNSEKMGKFQTLLVLFVLAMCGTHTAAQRLFFSKYVEGSGNNQGVEIFNPSCQSITLSEFALIFSANGVPFGFSQLALSGTLAPLGVYTVCRQALSGAVCNMTTSTLLFNGNDAIALLHNAIIIDVIGEERHYGSVATGWPVAGTTTATADHTLIRRSSVTQGRYPWQPTAERNNAYSSEWTVQAQNYFTNFGTSHVHTLSCPLSTSTSVLRKLTCGAKGDSSILSGSNGDSFEVECPQNCMMMYPGHVYGGASAYALSSYVCMAGVHAGATALTGYTTNPDTTTGNAPSTSPYLTIGEAAVSVYTHSSPMDVYILIDVSTSSPVTNQRDFVVNFVNSFQMMEDRRGVRFAVYRYASSTSTIQTLSAVRATVVSSVASMTTTTSANRNLQTALNQIATDSSGATNARVNAQRVVLVLSAGAYSANSYLNSATTLKNRGFSIYVVSINSALTAHQQVASGTEFNINVASASVLDTTILSLQQMMWQKQYCSSGVWQIAARPIFTVTLHTSATSTITGSITTCVQSLSLPAAATTFSVSSLSAVTCENSCTYPNGNCDPRTGMCSCIGKYFGDDCSKKYCETTCFNGGSCDYTTGTCSCASTYYGSSCLQRTCALYSNCNSATGNGVCDTATGLCTCYDPYHGASCDEKYCHNDCNGHGACLSTGTCVCTSGYGGDYCELVMCPNDCSGHGTCDYTTGRCDCDSDELTGHNGTCAHGRCLNDCSGHGTCNTLTRRCTCDDDWLGHDCSIART